MNTLESIGKISIPRNVVSQDLNDPIELIELHGFSDASLKTMERPFTFVLFLKGVIFL